MRKQIDHLTNFHRSFLDETEQIPTIPDEKQATLRYKLLKEENEEFLKACKEGNKVEILDALADCLYVILGTVHKCGMNNVIEEAFERVQRANMSKLDDNGLAIINGQNGVYEEDKPIGKFLKSKNYKKVDLTDLV